MKIKLLSNFSGTLYFSIIDRHRFRKQSPPLYYCTSFSDMLRFRIRSRCAATDSDRPASLCLRTTPRRRSLSRRRSAFSSPSLLCTENKIRQIVRHYAFGAKKKAATNVVSRRVKQKKTVHGKEHARKSYEICTPKSYKYDPGHKNGNTRKIKQATLHPKS